MTTAKVHNNTFIIIILVTTNSMENFILILLKVTHLVAMLLSNIYF